MTVIKYFWNLEANSYKLPFLSITMFHLLLFYKLLIGYEIVFHYLPIESIILLINY